MEARDEFISQVLTTIDEAEVLTIFFPNLAKALIVDVRRNFEEGAMVKVVNQVNSMEERMAAIEKMRPNMGRVRSIAGIPWTKSIRTLRENGVVERLQQRLTGNGEAYDRAGILIEDAYRRLQEIEQAQWVDLIKGTNPLYRNIWLNASRI
jgi:MinD-like ATPase involved in chromosome partitioning or flagellar assembly